MAIIRGPISIVFKTSNRSNAKTKMKTYKNKTIDDVLTKAKIPGIPEKAIILEVGVGSVFEEKFKEKYNL